jgi:ABC-type branched-subunit amino acid transport system ATPase component
MSQILEISSVTCEFGGIRAVDEVSIEVKPGSILGIIGPNGAGKTVLLNLINGVYKPVRGSIRIDGTPTARLRPDQVARLGVARTFQSTDQFKEFRAIDYVMLGGFYQQCRSLTACILGLSSVAKREKAESRRALEMLERLGLAHVATEHMAQLPYGVQKQVDLARAMAAEPRLLLLDEPTSGTTSTERAAIAEVLRSLGRTDRTVVVVDHDVRFLSGHCEQLVAMNYGRKIAAGPVTEVLADRGVREAYLGITEADGGAGAEAKAKPDEDEGPA